jgi:hypothetical protein
MRHNTTTSPVSIDAQAFSLKADTQEVPALVAHCGSYTRVRNGPRLSSPVPVEHPQACRMSHQRPTSFAVKGNVSNRIYWLDHMGSDKDDVWSLFEMFIWKQA